MKKILERIHPRDILFTTFIVIVIVAIIFSRKYLEETNRFTQHYIVKSTIDSSLESIKKESTIFSKRFTADSTEVFNQKVDGKTMFKDYESLEALHQQAQEKIVALIHTKEQKH